jgi:hypothetical protein
MRSPAPSVSLRHLSMLSRRKCLLLNILSTDAIDPGEMEICVRSGESKLVSTICSPWTIDDEDLLELPYS